MSYSIRRADLKADEDLFLDVLSRNLGVAGREGRRERFRWFYVDNPAGQGAAYLLSLVDADGQKHVVGCTGLGMRNFVSAGRSCRAALLADFAVDAQHRSLLPALRLQRNAQEWLGTEFELSYGFPNSQAIGVFRRLGYREGVVSRYVRVLRHQPYVARLVPIQAAARFGGAILDRALKVRDRLRRRVGPGLRLEWLRDVDARFDRLFDEARLAYRLLGDRGAAFLRWRFFQRVGEPAEIAALVSQDGSSIRAYAAVLAREGSVASIEDFLGATPEDLSLLLGPLLGELRDRSFTSASAEFAGDPRVKDVLAAHTFVPRETSAVIMAPGPGLAGDQELPKDPAAWYVTMADTDT